MSVDDDKECKSQCQISKGSIKGLQNEKAKSHRRIYLTRPLDLPSFVAVSFILLFKLSGKVCRGVQFRRIFQNGCLF